MSQSTPSVVVTGTGWEIPAFHGHATLSDALAAGPASEPLFDPALQLGRKGLRYKERATLLALCACGQALADAGFSDAQGQPLDDAEFGVVVATNTCNLDTVCRAAEIIRREHVNATSVMDLPNASSNVVSAAIAIRFGLGAINLTVCSGASAAIDALVLASNAIRNGRARRMLVVAVETDGPAVRSLLAGQRSVNDEGDAAVLESAAAVVLEGTCGDAPSSVARMGNYAFGRADASGIADLHGLLAGLPPRRSYVSRSHLLRATRPAWLEPEHMTVDMGPLADRTYGCSPLLALVHHCEQARAGSPSARSGAMIVSGPGWGDGRCSAMAIEPRGVAS